MRTLVKYAILGVLFLVLLKVAGALFGVVFSIAMFVLFWGAIGWIAFQIWKRVDPIGADRFGTWMREKTS